MGNFLTTHKWGNEWDGIPESCVRFDHDTGFSRSEIHDRLKKLSQDPANGGYILQGRPGSGKREIVLDTLKRSRTISDPIWITGSEYAKQLPYGAIQYLLTELSEEQLVSPLAVYGHLHRQFRETDRPNVVMENISVIDSATTMVLTQLVTNRVITLLVMDDRQGELAEDLQVLVRSGVLSLVRLGGLGLEESKHRIEANLGYRISYLTASRLWEFSAGNPESIDAIVADCREADQFVFQKDYAALKNEPLHIGIHLELRVAAQMERLNSTQQQMYKKIALGNYKMVAAGTTGFQELDFLHAQGLIEQTSTGWKPSEPCMHRALRSLWPEPSVSGEEGATVSDFVTVIDFQRVAQSHFADVRSHETGQTIEMSGASNRRLRNRLQELRAQKVYTAELQQVERIDLTLRLLTYYLETGEISQAAPLVRDFLDHGSWLWRSLSQCQQHLVLAQAAEFYARVNELDKSTELLDALLAELPQNPRSSSEYCLANCMAMTLRSLINTAAALARWAECSSLIDLVLRGKTSNPELIAYAEVTRSLALSITGNFAEAMESINPLRLQIFLSGSESAKRWIGVISAEEDDARVIPQDPASNLTEQSSLPFEEPVNTQECVRLLFEILASRQINQYGTIVPDLERLARWALVRGEKLLASHIWALCIREGRFDRATDLENLQVAVKHPLALGFLKLVQATKDLSAARIFDALHAMVSLGYVSYANDRFNALFARLSAHQNRVLVRSAKQGMGSRHPEISEAFGYTDLDKLTGLTRREIFVASAAANGMTNAEIAQRANVSVRTVEGHLYQVYSKLGIGKRDELQKLVANQRKSHSNATR